MIRIFNKNIVPLAEIDKYQSFIFERNFYGIGDFELHIIYEEGYDKLFREGHLVMLDNDERKVGIMKDFEIDEDEDGKETLTVRGLSLKSLISQRIILPQEGEYDRVQGNQEYIMKQFVINNFIDTSEDRKLYGLFVEGNKGLGIDDGWRAKKGEIVSDKLEEIGKYAELGWDIRLDYKNRRFVFDVFKGKDLTLAQSDNAGVIFSTDFDNIESQNYLNAHSNYKNVIYAENEDLTQAIGEAKGIDRYEYYQKYSDLTITELKEEAKRTLKEYEIINTLNADVIEGNSFIFEKDYRLGDYVSFKNNKWNLTMDTQIVAITESYELGYKDIELHFGNDIPTILDRVKELKKKQNLFEGGSGGTVGYNLDGGKPDSNYGGIEPIIGGGVNGS